MYQPRRYLTMELLSDIVAEYDWPVPYTLEDDLPDGIIMRFPSSNLVFVEGFEGEMDLRFLPEDTGTETTLGFTHALMALVPESERDPHRPLTPGLIGNAGPEASLEKVANGIRDLCTIALYHLRPCILGDFSWVEKYQEIVANLPE